MSIDSNSFDIDNLYEFHRMMISQNMFLVYNGPVTQEITNSFLSITKNRIRAMVEEKSILRKIGFIMVECLQNIYKHEAKPRKDETVAISSIFLLGSVDGNFIIESGNRIHNEDVDPVAARLEELNKMTHEELVRHYKQKLVTANLSNKGGAGLGLIDAAIKSRQKFEWYFKKIDKDYSFFSLRVKVSKNKAA